MRHIDQIESLIKDNLIIKQKNSFDKRNIIYSITPEGKIKALKILTEIKKIILTKLEHKNNIEEINKEVNALLKLIS